MSIVRDRIFLQKVKKLRKSLWYERLLFFPIKLGIAYVVYAHFDDGIFFILAYILFCVSEQSALHFVNTQELNELIHKDYDTLNEQFSEHFNNIYKEIHKIEEQSLNITELDGRLNDLEQRI